MSTQQRFDDVPRYEDSDNEGTIARPTVSEDGIETNEDFTEGDFEIIASDGFRFRIQSYHLLLARSVSLIAQIRLRADGVLAAPFEICSRQRHTEKEGFSCMIGNSSIRSSFTICSLSSRGRV
jgi:hypothetical protein